MPIKRIARFLDVPGVKVSIILHRDNGASEEGAEPVLRGMVVVACDHAAARTELASKMKAKNLGPVFLRGTADEIQRDITEGRVLGRIQERIVLAKEAEEGDSKNKQEKAEAKAEAPKRGRPKKEAAPVPTPPAATKPSANVAGIQTSLLDSPEVEEEETTETPAPAEQPVTMPKEISAPAPAAPVGPGPNKRVVKFKQIVDELRFVIEGGNKNLAVQKLDDVKKFGAETHKLDPKLFKEDAEAKAAYADFVALKAKVEAMPEDEEATNIFGDEE